MKSWGQDLNPSLPSSLGYHLKQNPNPKNGCNRHLISQTSCHHRHLLDAALNHQSDPSLLLLPMRSTTIKVDVVDVAAVVLGGTSFISLICCRSRHWYYRLVTSSPLAPTISATTAAVSFHCIFVVPLAVVLFQG